MPYNYQLIAQLRMMLYTAPAVLLAITFHEYAHGYMAYRLGDATAKYDGRLTLNPFRHLDAFGTICLLVFHVGWAKPVRVNVRNLKNLKRDMVWIALAGPLTNFLLAFVSILCYGLFYKYNSGTNAVVNYLETVCYYSGIINVGLGVFNLIPVPPLDGSNVIRELIPGAAAFYRKIGRYSGLVLMALLVFGVLSVPLNLLDSAIINGIWDLVRKILRIGVFIQTPGNVI